jgi:hypothetical protein
MALGNNRESLLIRRINVPFFDSLGNTPNGQKFFFPEHPEIDNKIVVGIEAHIRTVLPGGNRGDFDQSLIQNNLSANFAPFVYVSFFNDQKEEIFFNVPLVSLFGRLVGAPNSPKQKIKPYLGKIKTRNCYCYIPANATITIGQDFYINFTFYLK